MNLFWAPASGTEIERLSDILRDIFVDIYFVDSGLNAIQHVDLEQRQTFELVVQILQQNPDDLND